MLEKNFQRSLSFSQKYSVGHMPGHSPEQREAALGGSAPWWIYPALIFLWPLTFTAVHLPHLEPAQK